jgi:cysteinyl-tRNA synthetase
VEFREADLERSAEAAAFLRRACLRAEAHAPAEPALADASELQPEIAALRSRFLAAMDDDLDTPRAMPVLDELARLALEADDDHLASQAGWMIRELGARILGLRLAAAPTTVKVAA